MSVVDQPNKVVNHRQTADGGGGSNTRRNQRRRWGKGDVSSLCCGESVLSLNGSDEGSVDHKGKQSPAADHLFPRKPQPLGELGSTFVGEMQFSGENGFGISSFLSLACAERRAAWFQLPVRPSTGRQRVDMLPSWCSPLRGCSSLAFRCVSPTKSSMLM